MVLRGVLVAFTVVAVLGTPAWQPARAASRLQRRATKAFNNYQFGRAYPLLKKALRRARTEDDRAEIHRMLATIHAAYGRKAQATRSFVEVLKRNPDFALPPDASPKLREAFEAAATKMAPTSEDEPPEAAGAVVAPAEPPADEGPAAGTDESGAVVAPAEPPADEGPAAGTDESTEVILAQPFASPVSTDPLPMGLDTSRRSAPFYEKWWFWTAAAVVIAGGAGITAWALNRDYAPDARFGPYVVSP